MENLRSYMTLELKGAILNINFELHIFDSDLVWRMSLMIMKG